ncbi:MAG TPA: GAF domain-containing protein [Anaerolineae bacterium]
MTYLNTALNILRDAAVEVNRIGPETSLADALRIIASTSVRLIDSTWEDEAAAVIYVYDAERRRFDVSLRVSAGEQGDSLFGNAPRSNGMGFHAIHLQRRILSYEDTFIPLHEKKREAGFRTMACYPLLVSGVPVGALYVSLRTERRFSDNELLILDMFVHLAAVAIHNTRRFERVNRTLQRKVDELQRLRRAEHIISSRLNLDETLREILNTALELTHAEHGSFRLLDKRASVLRLSAIVGGNGEEREREDLLPVNEHGSVMGWVAVHRRPARIADLHEQPWADIYRPLHRTHVMRSELAVPLLGAGGGLEGVLNVESPAIDAFDEDDQRLLEVLATQAIIAIQEAKLLETIEEISSRMLSQPLPDLLMLIVEHACDLINAPFGSMWTLTPDRPDTLVLSAGTAGHTIGEILPGTGSLIGQAVHLKQPLTSHDVRTDPRFMKPDLARRMGWVSALIVPLLGRDRGSRGALALYTDEPRTFSAWDVRLLTWLANHTAVVIQDAEHIEQLKIARERQAVAETFAALGDVAANLLHRVNNRVGVIPVRIEGITEKRPAVMDDPYVRNALRDIQDGARAALEAARESMAYLRPLNLQATSVDVCYRTALTRLAIPATVQITANGLDQLPPVWAGEEQLRLIFVNLIENALEALSDRDGWIRVHGQVTADPLDQSRSWVEIRVADSGSGVPAGARERIFELAYSTKHSLNKLGFGLWWVKSLTQRFGGSITLAEDSAPGCVFIVRLPPAQDKTLPQVSEPAGG